MDEPRRVCLLHREEMERLVDDALAWSRAKKVTAEPMSDVELAEAEKSARILMAGRFAKASCELRGVA